MMTRRDFASIAEGFRIELNRIQNSDDSLLSATPTFVSSEIRRQQWVKMVAATMTACAQSNPRFNRRKFVEACGAEFDDNGNEILIPQREAA